MDYSLPGSSVHGILQARILEWVAISFSSPVLRYGFPRAATVQFRAPGGEMHLGRTGTNQDREIGRASCRERV